MINSANLSGCGDKDVMQVAKIKGDSPIAYAEAGKHAILIELQDVSIPIVGLDDLIRMKENTGREQDEADIRYLKGLKT